MGQRLSLRSLPRGISDQRPPPRAVFVVLVEDSPADALLVRKAFEEHGIEGEMTLLTDGEMAIHFIQAVEALEYNCPDLVILDLNLPKKPGRAVLEQIRRSEKCRVVPVIVLSSSDAEADKADAARLGVSRYIRKPSRLEEFLGLGVVFRETLRPMP